MISFNNDHHMYFLNGEDLTQLQSCVDNLLLFKKAHDLGMDLMSLPNLETESYNFFGYRDNDLDNFFYVCAHLLEIELENIEAISPYEYADALNEGDLEVIEKVENVLGDYKDEFQKDMENYEHHIIFADAIPPGVKVKPRISGCCSFETFQNSIHMKLDYLGEFHELFDEIAEIYLQIKSGNKETENESTSDF